jgi:hypothetical protein
MSLSNFELEKLARKYNIKLDMVLSRDEILSNLELFRRYPNWNIIINLQSLYSDKGLPQNGSHWVSLIRVSDTFLYMDSYGFPPPEEVKILINKIDPKARLIYNEKQIQKVNTDKCGYYSLFFIDFIRDNLKKNFKMNLKTLFNKYTEQFVSVYEDKKKNDGILKRLMKKYF